MLALTISIDAYLLCVHNVRAAIGKTSRTEMVQDENEKATTHICNVLYAPKAVKTNFK